MPFKKVYPLICIKYNVCPQFVFLTPLERIALCILDLLPSIDNFVYNAELIRSELLLTGDDAVAGAALIGTIESSG